MAVKKTSTKTSKKAESNLKLSDVKMNSKNKKEIEKTVKKTSGKAFLFSLIFLLIGIAIGCGTWWIVCKNDCFELLGNEEIVLTLDEKYVDEGVKIISFGKDDSLNYDIETNLSKDENGKFYSDEVGTFYIKYSSQNFKYGKLFKVEKVRLITFVETSEGGE